MTIYELFDGMDGEPIGYYKTRQNAETSMKIIMDRYGVDDPDELELLIFERHVSEFPIED